MTPTAGSSLAALPTRAARRGAASRDAGRLPGRGGRAGIKASGRPDLALIATTTDADGRPHGSGRGNFTPNAFAAAPVTLSRAHLAATAARRRGPLRLGRGGHLHERLRQRSDRRRR